MSKPGRPANRVIIHLRQKRGPLSSYWTAAVRRSRKGPILYDNSDSSREIALAGAENWCRRLGYQTKIQED